MFLSTPVCSNGETSYDSRNFLPYPIILALTLLSGQSWKQIKHRYQLAKYRKKKWQRKEVKTYLNFKATEVPPTESGKKNIIAVTYPLFII